MKIAEIYSHLNGHEYLLVHRPQLWQEIQAVVAGIDAHTMKTKVSKEVRMAWQMKYNPKALNAAFQERLGVAGWQESRVSYWVTRDQRLIRQTLAKPPAEQKHDIEAAGERAIASYNQTDFVKDRVAVEVQFGKYAFVAYDLFVKHLAFYVGDHIDVGIEILPMKSMQQHMSSGPAYYEGELYNVIRNGRGVPGVPLVLVGIEP
ncbi:MAG: BglII/BstYI family type II restriction endonuclease [Xanthomonadales bacterium]|nr:BglII/BstYI family type II restriction endonuclease [Xanthomonadales bacterium]MDZ4378979.1 BglII/BstYI family type II restriction endonuclease [Xanthomonadaceae bacterium]